MVIITNIIILCAPYLFSALRAYCERLGRTCELILPPWNMGKRPGKVEGNPPYLLKESFGIACHDSFVRFEILPSQLKRKDLTTVRKLGKLSPPLDRD